MVFGGFRGFGLKGLSVSGTGARVEELKACDSGFKDQGFCFGRLKTEDTKIQAPNTQNACKILLS